MTQETYLTLFRLRRNGSLDTPTNTAFVTWFKAVVDSITCNLLSTTVGQEGNDIVDGGRVLPSGIMVVAEKFVPQSEPGGPYRPRLLVFHEQGASHVALPLAAPVNAPANDSAATVSPFPGVGVAIPLTDGRILQGSPMGGQNGGYELATYAAVVELGATAAQDRADTRFGLNRATQFVFRLDPACTLNSPPLQRAVRFSNWLSRPAARIRAPLSLRACSRRKTSSKVRSTETEQRGRAAAAHRGSYADRSCAASCASRVIAGQSAASTSAWGVSHDPPTAITFGSASHCFAVCAVMPPVVQKPIAGSGEASARTKSMPPAGTAGKNFCQR